jgi:hypothetical protein
VLEIASTSAAASLPGVAASRHPSAAPTRATSPLSVNLTYRNLAGFTAPAVPIWNNKEWFSALYERLNILEHSAMNAADNGPLLWVIKNVVLRGINLYYGYQSTVNNRMVDYINDTGKYVFSTILHPQELIDVANKIEDKMIELCNLQHGYQALYNQYQAMQAARVVGPSSVQAPARKPKMAEPPKFSGTSAKAKLNK